jgi:hypothetical protein
MKLQSWLDRFPTSSAVVPPTRLDNRLTTANTTDKIDENRVDGSNDNNNGDGTYDPINTRIGSTLIPIRPVDDIVSNNFDPLLSDVKLLSAAGRKVINNNHDDDDDDGGGDDDRVGRISLGKHIQGDDGRRKERPQSYQREHSGNSSSGNNNIYTSVVDVGDNSSIQDVMDSMKRDFKSEIRESVGVIGELKSELARLKELNISLTDALNRKEADLELANDHHNELMSSIQNDLFDANNENDDLRDEIDSLKEQLRDHELGNMSHHSIDNNNNDDDDDDDDVEMIHNEPLVLEDKSSSSILSTLKKENDLLQIQLVEATSQLEAYKEQTSILEAQIVGLEDQKSELEERQRRQCEDAKTHDSRQEQMIVMLKQLMQQKDIPIQLLQQQQLQQHQQQLQQQQSIVSSVATPSKTTQEISKNTPIISNAIDNTTTTNNNNYQSNSIYSAQISSLKEQLEDTIKELEDVKSLQLTQMTNSLKLIKEQQQQEKEKGTTNIATTKSTVEAVEETKSDEDTANNAKNVLMLQTQLQGIQKERDTLVVQLRNSELRCRLLQEQVSTIIITLIDVFLTY